MTDDLRERFEKWFSRTELGELLVSPIRKTACWEAYQAGAESSSQELRELERRITLLRAELDEEYAADKEIQEILAKNEADCVALVKRAESAEAELQRLREALPGLATKIVENAYRNSIPQRPVIGDAIEVEAALLAKWMAAELGMK